MAQRVSLLAWSRYAAVITDIELDQLANLALRRFVAQTPTECRRHVNRRTLLIGMQTLSRRHFLERIRVNVLADLLAEGNNFIQGSDSMAGTNFASILRSLLKS